MKTEYRVSWIPNQPTDTLFVRRQSCRTLTFEDAKKELAFHREHERLLGGETCRDARIEWRSVPDANDGWSVDPYSQVGDYA